MGRGRPMLIRNRQSSDSPTPQVGQSQSTIGPLTIVADNMTNEDEDRAIEDAKKGDTELLIKDINGKIFQNSFETPKRGEKEEEEIEKLDEKSEQELLSNLSSSTEIEQETKEHNLRRSIRSTKTNPITRLNNPVSSDYTKHSQKTKQPGNNTRHQLNTIAEQDCPERHFDDRTSTTDAAGNTAATQRLGWTTASKGNNTPHLLILTQSCIGE